MTEKIKQITRGKIIAGVLGIVWLTILTLSYLRNAAVSDNDVYSLALNEARSHFKVNVTYRNWVAQEGGVYVQVSDRIVPNPYLKVPDRDIESTGGHKLTLINPAYLTRLVCELEYETNHVKGHITSLDPIRPENKADKWEKAALHTFNKGEKEYHSILN